ncbi:helix-turn-helix transcriptional regulator [Serratia fonticola]
MSNQLTELNLLEDKLVDMTFITSFTGLTDKWFYKLISEGKFPKPIKLGRSSRWLYSEVHIWVRQRIEQSRGQQQAEISLVKQWAGSR